MLTCKNVKLKENSKVYEQYLFVLANCLPFKDRANI